MASTSRCQPIEYKQEYIRYEIMQSCILPRNSIFLNWRSKTSCVGMVIHWFWRNGDGCTAFVESSDTFWRRVQRWNDFCPRVQPWNLLHRHQELLTTALKAFYFVVYIATSFDYCSLVWDISCSSDSTHLQRFQNYAICTIFKLPKSPSASEALSTLHWTSLSDRWQQKLLSLSQQLLQPKLGKTVPSYLRNLLPMYRTYITIIPEELHKVIGMLIKFSGNMVRNPLPIVIYTFQLTNRKLRNM